MAGEINAGFFGIIRNGHQLGDRFIIKKEYSAILKVLPESPFYNIILKVSRTPNTMQHTQSSQ